MTANIDLRQLVVQRDQPAAKLPRSTNRRQVLTRYALPGGVLLGFLVTLGWAARDSFLPSKEVTVVPVLASTDELFEDAGTPLFQAAGWVEPRPTPVIVTALAEGVIEQLLVVEGQEVRAGEPVARLIEADTRLALNAAQAEQRLREAELEGARAVRDAARVNLAQPVQLQAALAEAEAMLARTETELTNLPHQRKAAEARLSLASFDLERKRKAVTSGAVSESALRVAESERDSSQASAEELKGREPRLTREADALKRKCDALRKRLELKTDEIQKLAEAEASVKTAEAKLEQSRVALDIAKLRLERMTVRAPRSGRVLALVARPGMRLMGLAQGTYQESSTVVTLYDPASLQVRADVRFENVPRVVPGQPVQIESPAVPGGALEGIVLFATATTDIQKNTLQVKVAIKSPPPTLKPDMLVQVTFLAPPVLKDKPTETMPRYLVPRSLVETSDRGSTVWIADRAAGVARRRSVKLGPGGAGDVVTVLDGLSAGDKVIASGREGLREGQRIQVTDEDATLGIQGRGDSRGSGRITRTPPAAKQK